MIGTVALSPRQAEIVGSALRRKSGRTLDAWQTPERGPPMNGSLTSISYDPHRPVTTRMEALAMAVKSLTYAALGQRLGCSPEAARALAKRLRLPRQKANDGKALVVVDLTEIDHKPLPARSPVGHLSVTDTLQAKIEAAAGRVGQSRSRGRRSPGGFRA